MRTVKELNKLLNPASPTNVSVMGSSIMSLHGVPGHVVHERVKLNYEINESPKFQQYASIPFLANSPKGFLTFLLHVPKIPKFYEKNRIPLKS